jgi:hypothetical protein
MGGEQLSLGLPQGCSQFYSPDVFPVACGIHSLGTYVNVHTVTKPTPRASLCGLKFCCGNSCAVAGS